MEEDVSGISSPLSVPCFSYASPSSNKDNSSSNKTKNSKNKGTSNPSVERHKRLAPVGKMEDSLGLVGYQVLESSTTSSLTSSPTVSRPTNRVSRRPRAKTFSHSYSSSWESSEVEKGKLRREKKSISVLCDLFQQGGKFDSSPVLNRVRNTKGLSTTTNSSSLPFVEGSPSAMYYRHSDLSKSPYHVSMASQHVRKSHTLPVGTGSPGFVRKPRTRDLPNPKAATLPRLDKAPPNKVKTKRQLSYSPGKEVLLGKNSIPFRESGHSYTGDTSEQENGEMRETDKPLDHIDESSQSDSLESTNPCPPVLTLPPGSGDAILNQDQPSQQQTDIAGLGIPSILVRSATPSNYNSTQEEDEGEQVLMQQFVIRAELAEELRKLSQDVQEIVETNKSILNKED